MTLKLIGPATEQAPPILAFVDLTSGKIAWELNSTESLPPEPRVSGRRIGAPKSGSRIGSPKTDLSDSHFLGAPLSLDGKLYVLNDKGSQLRLVCIQPSAGAGKVVWVRSSFGTSPSAITTPLPQAQFYSRLLPSSPTFCCWRYRLP